MQHHRPLALLLILALLLPALSLAAPATVDLNADGVPDTVHLTPASDEDVHTVVVDIIDGKTSAPMAAATIDFPFQLAVPTLRCAVVSADGGPYLAIHGDMLGGTVAATAAAILALRDGDLTDLFADYADAGIPYDVSLHDGPFATVTPVAGGPFTIVPDRGEYLANGWIDDSGALTPGVDPEAYQESRHFTALTTASVDGALTLYGVQTLYGNHKQDILGDLHTTWQYDGATWQVATAVAPYGPGTAHATAVFGPAFDGFLHYNNEGGKYYHTNPTCESVSAQYLPLTAFTFPELFTSPYTKLRPCPHCTATNATVH